MGYNGGIHWSTVPDVVGTIVACRAWQRTTGWATSWPVADGNLYSMGVRSMWTRGVNTAMCVKGDLSHDYCLNTPGHPAPPGPDCACGFWGVSSWSYLREIVGYITPDSEDYVLGIVEMWGKVVPGDRGWRSQYARVTAVTSRPVAAAMGVRYLGVGYDRERLTPPMRRFPSYGRKEAG